MVYKTPPALHTPPYISWSEVLPPERSQHCSTPCTNAPIPIHIHIPTPTPINIPIPAPSAYPYPYTLPHRAFFRLPLDLFLRR